MRVRLLATMLVAFAALCWQGRRVDAHITVVSQYTFNRDVRPILERRCAQCHAEGGVAPQPLRTYTEARAQSLQLRQVLLNGTMPPWSAESSLMAVKEQHPLPARELDVLMTWAAGGTPEGQPVSPVVNEPATDPAADVVIPMPKPFVLPAAVDAADHEVVLPASGITGKWIQAATVLPEAAAIARRAEVVIRSRAGEQVIALWLPGDAPQALAGNAGFLMPAGGSLVLRIHYRRPRLEQARDVSDRSRVALYIASAPGARVRTVTIASGRPLVTRALRVVGIRTAAASDNTVVTITATAPGSNRPRTLLRFTSRADWPRRYGFISMVELATRSRIDVAVAAAPRGLWQPLTSPAATALSAPNYFRGVLETVE